MHRRIASEEGLEAAFPQSLSECSGMVPSPILLVDVVGAIGAIVGAVYSLDRCLGWLAGAERR